MSDTPKHSVSVAGVVVDDQGRVLVIKRRDNGHWEPPGGVLELDECFEDGVEREVREETGLSVQVERLTGAYKNLRRGVVALVFACRPLGATAEPSDEASSVRWLTPAEVQRYMQPAYAVRVSDALSGKVHARTHDGVDLLFPGLDERRGSPES